MIFARRLLGCALLGLGCCLPGSEPAASEPALQRSTLMLAPSVPQLRTLPRFEPRWLLPASIGRQLADVLARSRFEPGLAAELIARFAPAGVDTYLAVPDAALLGRFTPAEREAWHSLLCFHHGNAGHRWPLSLGPAQVAALDAQPRWREAMRRVRATAMQHGDRLVYADLFALEDAFASPADRHEFFGVAIGGEAFLLTLRRRTGEPLDAQTQAAWWQMQGRHRAIEPLLNAVAAIPDAPRLDVAHLLPRLPRALLNTFPPNLSQAEDPGVESSLLASSFADLVPGADPRDPGGLRAWLEHEAVPVSGPPQYGDLFVYGNLERTAWPYAGVYIGDNVVFARRPTLAGAWQLLAVSDIGRLNPRFYGMAPRVFRRRITDGTPGPAILPGRAPEAWRQRLALQPLPPGPWGRLWCYEVLLAPSGNILAQLPTPDPVPVWTFSGIDRAGLLAAVAACPMPPEVRQELATLFTSAESDPEGRLTVRPTFELVLAVPPEFRASAFPHLVGGLGLTDYVQHIPFPAGFTIDKWFEAGSLPESVRQAILRLVYPVGDRVMLSDFGALYRLLGSRQEQLSALRAALREPALVVLLERPRPEEVPALAEFWRHTGRTKSTQRLLEAFAATGDDSRFLDIVHLLSPIERELLNGYHVPTMDAPTPSCFWTAFNFGADQPDPRFLLPPGFTGEHEALAAHELAARYDAIDAPSQLGDLVAYRRRGRNEVIHACVFIAEGIVLTKNGYNFSKPWCLSRTADVDALYLGDPGIERIYYRRRGGE